MTDADKKNELTPTECAIVIAQAAMMNAEVAGMVALNKEREGNGYSLAYDEYAFLKVSDNYPLLKSVALMERGAKA